MTRDLEISIFYDCQESCDTSSVLPAPKTFKIKVHYRFDFHNGVKLTQKMDSYLSLKTLKVTVGNIFKQVLNPTFLGNVKNC